ncbi:MULTISPECIES: hypothetical protein [unclassified Streptomyces]|uniref:hypothetical protein n=1 Tax=unclassified Streptomyces TaxID=2593676 RepID=UPI0011467F79|nr:MULTISPECIES: hypothetical protein [unclassified Streptomyces]MYR76569.1 hypothetical protein [Streptomyces sp. SID4925]
MTVLNPDILQEPHVHACVEALASTLGGQLLYSQGTAAREVLLAAGVHVAAATHRPLVVIDDEALREDTADFLAALGLDETAAHFLTPAQAFQWLPQLGPQSVLAINREEDHAAHLFVGREPGGRVAAWETPVYWLRPAHEMNGTSSPLVVPTPRQKAVAYDDGTDSLTRAAGQLAAQHRLLGPEPSLLPQSLQPNPTGAVGEGWSDDWAQRFAEVARQSQDRLADAEAALQERRDLPDTPGRQSHNSPGLPPRQPGQQHDQGPNPHPGLAPGL